MEMIEQKFIELTRKYSDIYEHLPTLSKYARECESILECGVRGCVSSWAFAKGLMKNERLVKKLHMCDIEPCDVTQLLNATHDLDIQIKTSWTSDLDLTFNNGETYDLVFIDTFHCYGQLKRELAKFAPIANKYIIMHDTTSYGTMSETLMFGGNVDELMQKHNMTTHEILYGLQKAIDEFLEGNDKWILHEKYENNNGLTVLKRVG